MHIALLVTNELGPCACLVLQVGTGRFPLRLAQATRRWNETEWDAAVESLRERGWMTADATMTPEGIDARNSVEADTDRLCDSTRRPIGNSGAARFGELIMPIHNAIEAAGTYAAAFG